MVEQKIIESINLVTALDTEGIGPSFAVWFYYSDSGSWKFLMAGNSIDKLLNQEQNQAYLKLVNTMAKLDLMYLESYDIKLIRTDDKLLALRSMISTGSKGISRIHCSKNYLNGIFIEDAVILRAA